jgi:hypothetical protein
MGTLIYSALKLYFFLLTPTKSLRTTLSVSIGISLKAILLKGNSGIEEIPSATLNILITFAFDLEYKANDLAPSPTPTFLYKSRTIEEDSALSSF